MNVQLFLHTDDVVWKLVCVSMHAIQHAGGGGCELIAVEHAGV